MDKVGDKTFTRFYLTIYDIDGCTSLQKLKTAISQNDKSVT